MGRMTAQEAEFVAEMHVEPGSFNEWANFDPPFLRTSYAKFVRKGWLEYRGNGRDREFRWTETGRRALQEGGGE